jgi:hypothetical protein
MPKASKKSATSIASFTSHCKSDIASRRTGISKRPQAVGQPGDAPGMLQTIVAEGGAEADAVHIELAEKTGRIHADLSIGADVIGAKALRANEDLANRGFCLFGAGFIVPPEEVAKLQPCDRIHPYRNGRDLTDTPRCVSVIDLYGLTTDEARSRYPAAYQWVLERVKPERNQNKRESRRVNWWVFGEPNKKLREQLSGQPRYIATVETAKHRTFQFLDAAIAPDNKLVCIALADAYALGILSSQVHIVWTLATGSTLEDRPVYVKTTSFEKFPFAAASPEQQARIAQLAEQLDAHRKRQQAAHPELTLTGMYNVLTKLRSGEALSAKDKAIHETGLVAVLRQLHDELDAAVLAAYGWSDLAPGDSDTLLERLVALNAERSREEASGLIRWLRSDFQNPQGQRGTVEMDVSSDLGEAPAPSPAKPEKRPWPASLPEQVRAVADALTSTPQDEPAIAARFTGKGPWKKRLPEILAMLAALGRAKQSDGGWVG